MSSKEEKTGATNVQVAIRCRPPSADERKSSQAMCITNDQDARTVKASYGAPGKKMDKTFSFDKVFGMYSTQEDVFKGVVSPIVAEVLQGFNCTIFAYGQTGTGKTHTMQGIINSEEDAGIVPRAVKAILETLEAGEAEFTIRVSFLELYNEELQDLLSTAPLAKSGGDDKSKLKLCEDSKKGGAVVCQGLEEVTVMTVKDIMDILERGIQQRQTAETLCNKNSSRSHSIFTLKINIREYNAEGEEVVRLGQLNLVDLAGSECVGRSGAKNDRAREAGTINQSLLSLGRVITALVDHHSHIPYRDSKLTRLLQDSLGGKAKTCIIATLSPCQAAIEETLSTLDYASRAKNIKNKPQQNEKMTKKTVMKEYCAEIETLRQQLQITREKNGVFVDPEAYHNMVAKIANQESQLLECEGALKRTAEDIKGLKRDKEELSEKVAGVSAELVKTATELEGKTAECEAKTQELEGARAELRATEAVVAEQGRCEMELTQQGCMLLGETAARKADIAALLRKVEVLAGQEAQRSQVAAAFERELAGTQAKLSGGVQQLSGQCEQHAAALCDGVAKMLTHGKSSCAALQTAIDQALQQLCASSKHATGNMSTACGGLDSSLQETNAKVGSTLVTLQTELSKWLGEVDAAVSGAGEQLEQQKAKIASASAAMDASLTAHVDQMHAFAAKNEKMAATATATAAALKETIGAQMKDQTAAARQSAKQRENELQAKASALKQQFLTSLEELMQASAASSAASVADAEMCSTTVIDIVAGGCDDIARQVGAAQAAAKSAVGEQLVASVQSAHAAQSAMVAAITECGASAAARCAEVGASVGDRTAGLQSTVSGLVAQVDCAIGDNCAVVKQTALEATGLHGKVQEVSGALSASAGASLSEFNGLLRGEGEVLERELKAHFDTVGAVVAEQQDALLPALEAQKTTFSRDMAAAVVAPSGSTPTKAQQASLPYNSGPAPVLAATREHAVIKQEVYNGCWVQASPFKASSAASSARSSMSSVSNSSSASSSPSSGSAGRTSMVTVDTEAESVAAEDPAEEAESPPKSVASTDSGKKKRKLGALQPKEAALNASPSPVPQEEVTKTARLSTDSVKGVVEVLDVENVPETAAVAAPTRATRGARVSKIGVPARKVSSLR